jgi:hypothetical protein
MVTLVTLITGRSLIRRSSHKAQTAAVPQAATHGSGRCARTAGSPQRGVCPPRAAGYRIGLVPYGW